MALSGERSRRRASTVWVRSPPASWKRRVGPLVRSRSTVVTMAVGTMLGGTLITYRRPRARHLAAFIVAMELFSTLGIFSAMFFSCEPPVFSSQYPT